MAINQMFEARTSTEIYDSADRDSPAWREARELWQYRSLIALLVVNSFRTRYRRSAVGIVWIFLNPVMNMVVLSIAFSSLFIERVRDYPTYVLVGFLVWHFFTQATTGAIHSAVEGGGMAKRLYLPRTLYLVADAGTSAVNLLLGLIPLALVLLLLGTPIPPTWLLFPVVMVFLVMFALGVGMCIAVAAVYFGDVAHIFQISLPALFFLTPIVYPITILPEPFRTIISYNPLWWLIVWSRAVLTDGILPPPEVMVSAAAVSTLAFFAGWWIYTRRAAEFIYYV